MSRRLLLLNLFLRHCVRPVLARTVDVARARREFKRVSGMFRVPPYVLHLVEMGKVPLHWISVRRRRTDWVILYLHGGGYVAGSPLTHKGLAGRVAKLTQLQVVLPDYRLAPEHPAPAAFEDACWTHGQLLAKGYEANRIILAGDSAGGGLALALMADLCARDSAPAGLFAFSPWTDLAMTGPSLQSNSKRDSVLPSPRMPDVIDLILGELDPRDPRISPLYADFDRPPPVLIQVGQEEILLDDSQRMGAALRRVGGEAMVAEWPGCPHVWHLLDGYLPEARRALEDVAAFVLQVVDRANLNALSQQQGDS